MRCLGRILFTSLIAFACVILLYMFLPLGEEDGQGNIAVAQPRSITVILDEPYHENPYGDWYIIRDGNIYGVDQVTGVTENGKRVVLYRADVTPPPPGTGNPPPQVTPIPGEGGRVHVVQRGDTLYRIGLTYGVPWPTLDEVNNLQDPNLIYPGQQIIIRTQ